MDGTKFRGAVEKELKKMAPEPAISFLSFDGCPTTPVIRKNLDMALKMLKLTSGYSLVDLNKLPGTDERRGYGSPTVLVNGRDLFGTPAPAKAGGLTCRLYAVGVPSAKQIAERLKTALGHGV